MSERTRERARERESEGESEEAVWWCVSCVVASAWAVCGHGACGAAVDKEWKGKAIAAH